MHEITRRRGGQRTGRGVALPTVLLVLIVLTLLGAAAVFTASTDLDIAGNGRSDLHALSVAEAGIHEALARLNIKDVGHPDRVTPAESGSPLAPVAGWSTTIVNKSSPGAGEVQSLTGAFGAATTLPVQTTVRYKIEDASETPVTHCDADGCDGDVVRFHTNFGFSGSSVPTGAAAAPPVLQLVSRYDGDGVKTVVVEAVRAIATINSPGTVRACGTVSCQGTQNAINGTSHPDSVAIVAGQSGGTGCNDSRVDPDPSANPNTVQVQACPSPAEDLFQQTFGVTREYMKQIADINAIAPFPAPPSGTTGKIIYVSGTDQSSWQGTTVLGSPQEPVIVVFEGDFRVQGNLTLYGVIYVTGNFEFGGGTQHYYGAAISQGSASMSLGGNTYFEYNPDVVNHLMDLSPFTSILWQN